MRIRKRQSSSSYSPLNLSDPHLVNRSPVVVQLDDATTHSTSVITAPSSLDRYQPSDQTLQLIGKLQSNGCDDVSAIGESGVHKHLNKQQPLEEVRGQESGVSEKKGNHTSKEDILVSQVMPSSTSFTQDGKWWEGEKAIPLKKRRGGLESEMEDKKMKAKMKTKMNKKCSMQKGEDEEDKEEDMNVRKKKSRGSAVLMEGSRCSRVNGRGWRCCQQTLVGYSLCEHHLGKGRLRSMTSVRNRSINTAPKKVHNDNLDSSSSLEKQATSVVDDNVDDDDDDDEKKPGIITKKRMKLGMVKARSMSSLLGQTNTQVSVPDQEIINK